MSDQASGSSSLAWQEELQSMASSIEKRQIYWLGVVRGLHNMKEGLRGYVDSKSKSQYIMLMEKVNAKCDGQTCTVSGNICDELRKEIKNNHVYHKLSLKNTDSTKWQNPDVGYWEVAKCYLSTYGYFSKTEPYQVDVSGLLTICINSKFFRENIENIEHFQKVRDIRNEVNHSSDCQLDRQKADQYLDMMIAVLQGDKDLISDDFAKHAAFQIQKIKDEGYDLPAFWQETKHELRNACDGDTSPKVSKSPVKDTQCEILEEIDFQAFRYPTKGEGFVYMYNATSKREGSKKDEEKVVQFFTDLNFFVCKNESDLKSKDLLEHVKDASDLFEKGEYYCCLVFVMAHGCNESIKCEDGKLLKLEQIYKAFYKKKIGKGIPKLVFIQACRTQTKDANKEYVAEPLTTNDGDDIYAKQDFIMFFATDKGDEAYRDEDTGSLFIQDIMRIFGKSYKEYSVLRMMEFVFRVANARGLQWTHMAGQLTRELFLKPVDS